MNNQSEQIFVTAEPPEALRAAAAADPDWAERALRPLGADIELPPYALAFLDIAGPVGGAR